VPIDSVRRPFCLVAALALACAPAPGVPEEDAALALHRDAIAVDGHSDTTPWFGDPEWDFGARHETGHEDLPRMREGGLDVQIWSIYLSKEEAADDPVPKALERMEQVHRLVARFPNDLALASTAADVRRIVEEGRIACLMGLEGGHLIDDDLRNLTTYQRLGARYLTLTHSFHTSWADSSGTNEVPPPLHGGLTEFGEEVVRELNRLGILVDVSHVSDDTFHDALRVSRAPVIASHSSVRAVADHPRNLSDPMLRALAENGGVVMINFYSGYVDAELVDPIRSLFVSLLPRITEIRTRLADDPVALRREQRDLLRGFEVPRTDLDTLLDHFDHAIRVAGPDHVGIGADWDGVASMPRGLGDVSELPNLTRGLLARGHSPETVRGVLGENWLRVMEHSERVARRMQRGES
jgi:membrane dipeptidase